jgi:hypothetical protein
MRRSAVALAAFVAFAIPHAPAVGQAPSPGPTFDVVSVKPHVAPPDAAFPGMRMNQRPDGGVTMTRVAVPLLIALAHQMSTADFVGLPDSATREYYDITATSSISNPTNEDRMAMLRAMLRLPGACAGGTGRRRAVRVHGAA